MFQRLLNPSQNHSFFLFGARGTGKSTFVRSEFSKKNTLWLDLLNDDQEERFRKRPQELADLLSREPRAWVVIDEIQKIPALLDVVHAEIERKKTRFVLTGSSARKLKRSGVNLLAGRAFTYHLSPLTELEMGASFDLEQALNWGTLPGIFAFEDDRERQEFLKSYALNYVKQEIIAEQIIRKVDPFRDFLPIAAQSNTQIINYTKISDDVGVDHKTVESYFQILEDTLIGFRLQPHHRSIRKRQREAPKFYLFDPGVKRALEQKLRVPLQVGSYGYGRAFEHWVILEAHRQNEYRRLDYQFSYVRTQAGAEIDLIIDRPGETTLLIEIKSSDRVTERDTGTLELFLKDWKTRGSSRAEAMIWSQDSHEKRIGKVLALPWQKGLREAGL